MSETKHKGGPVRTGTLDTYRGADGKTHYRGRIRLADGTRFRLDVPDGMSEAKSREFVAAIQEREDKHGALLAKKLAKAVALAPKSAGETCDEWYARYHAYQRELGRSAAPDALSSWKGWISPRIGAKPIATITKDDIEDVRDVLDASIQAWRTHGRGPGRVSGKRAMNVWSALSSAFKAATSSKRRDLRLRDVNPCAGVEPPGDKDSRKARRKPFVFPSEFARLMACADVPREWRELHAVAAFTCLRPGELRALRWEDLDLEHGRVNVTRAWDSRSHCEKVPKTRNGVRAVPIHPSLAPLLARMHEHADDPRALVVPLLASVPEDDVAELTRAHLRLAGVSRMALFVDSATTVQANFRSWRDSGITWLAMTGLGVDKIMRRAGHDVIQTTMGYVKQAEDVGGELGEPFAPLPEELLASVSGPPNPVPSGRVGPSIGPNWPNPSKLLRRGRDSNPRQAFDPRSLSKGVPSATRSPLQRPPCT